MLSLRAVSVLAVLSLAVAAAAAAAVAPPFQCGSGNNETRLASETLGGRRIEQRLRLAPTAMHGCRWILDNGGDYTDYVGERGGASSCQRIRVTGGPTGGSWTASFPTEPALDARLFGKCRHHLGVDCQHHLTAYQDASKACPYEDGDPICPGAPRQLSGALGGRRYNATWIQLDLVPGNASSCAWVLLGSSASLWTHASNATGGRACLTCSRSAAGTAEAAACTSPTSTLAGPGCQHVLGPDCRPYIVDADDFSLPCRERPAASASSGASSSQSRHQSSSSSSSSDAGYRMLMSDNEKKAASATAAPAMLLWLAAAAAAALRA